MTPTRSYAAGGRSGRKSLAPRARLGDPAQPGPPSKPIRLRRATGAGHIWRKLMAALQRLLLEPRS